MAQQTILGPSTRHTPFNTGDSVERGDHPKDIADKINAMLTELGALANIAGPPQRHIPFNTGDSAEFGDNPKDLIDKVNARFVTLGGTATLIGPSLRHVPFNTGDSVEYGDHPKDIADKINTAFAALYAGGGPDPLAPPAPTLDLVAASDTGASSTDNITSDTTPDIDIILGAVLLSGDVLDVFNFGVLFATHTVTVGEAGTSTFTFSAAPLTDGAYSFTCKHTQSGHTSLASAALPITIDTIAPTITTNAAQSNQENSVLAVSLTASESVVWTLTGGADQARFEISGTTLRWTGNGTKDFEAPNDSNTDNAYVVQVTATDVAGGVTNKTITVTVTDVNEAPVLSNAIPDQIAIVGAALSFQFASNTFTDVDAGDVLTYTATKADNSALPAWLTFTGATRTFSGTPAGGDVGTTSIKVTATDTGALTATDTFDLSVTLASGVISSPTFTSYGVGGAVITQSPVIVGPNPYNIAVLQ